MLSELVKLSLYTGLFDRRPPDCRIWDDGLPESEENSPSQKAASRVGPLTMLTLFKAVQITLDVEGLKKRKNSSEQSIFKINLK